MSALAMPPGRSRGRGGPSVWPHFRAACRLHHGRNAAFRRQEGCTRYPDQGRRHPGRSTGMAAKRQRLAQRRKASGYTQEQFADALSVDRTTVQRWERGEVEPQPHQRPKMAKLLRLTSKELDELLAADVLPSAVARNWITPTAPASDDEMAAWELSRRVQSSDVGSETLTRLERAFDGL